MKKTILFAAVAIGTLLFPACNEKKQSEMTMDAIQGRATIQGRIMYDQGALQVEDAMLVGVNMTPAKDVTVSVKVPYSEYKSTSEGNAIYTTKTDAEGNYSISIPVGSEAVTATVSVLPFYADYGQYQDGTISTIEGALFTASTSAQVSLDQGDIQIQDVELVNPDFQIGLPERSKSLTLKGKVMYIGEVVEVDPYDSENKTYVKGSIERPNVPLTIYLLNNNSSEASIVYNVTTDAAGEFNLTAKFYDTWEYNFTVIAEVKASYVASDSENAFSHYAMQVSTGKWTIQNLAGVYQEAYTSKSVDSSNEFLAMTLDLEQEFDPEDESIIRGIGNPDIDYDQDGVMIYSYNNPMNWWY